MFKSLFVKIFVPIVALMVALGASLYFGVLRSVNEFARQNIENDLKFLAHDLFNVVDHGFFQSIKSGRADDPVAVRINQVDTLDILERNTYSRQFQLIVFEKESGKIRLKSDLPGQVSAAEIIQRFQAEEDESLLQIAGEDFHVRQFYFSPWDWSFLVLKNKRTYAELSQRVHRVYQTSAIALLIATSLLVLYLLRSITHPLASIVSSVSQGKSPDYKGTFEFEFLSQAINDMRNSLKNEVAERKRAEQAAESANQFKSEFLANMSHELRTPLNAILGFAQIMERNRTSPTDEESLRIIQRSGNYLLTLINQVLDLSKIEAGRVTLEKDCFDLFHLLDELKSMLKFKVAKKRIRLSFDINGDVPRYICTDEMKVRQVLINLLGNAIKFTDEGSVVLRVSTQNQNRIDSSVTSGEKNNSASANNTADFLLSFEIADTGVGIAQEEMEHMFEAFGQTSSGKKVGQGTGLGLVISKKFIELLGGEISLESEVGKGSKFSFKIPVREIKENEPSLVLPISRAVALEPGQPSYRILIVDDNDDNRQLLSNLLRPFGFELREAANGQKALQIQEYWDPQLILMDIRMPVMDGLEATKIIRAQASRARQPWIIAVTANVMQDNLELLLREGCDDILIKPFKEDDLFELLRKHLDLKFVYEQGPMLAESNDLHPKTLRLSPADFDILPEETVLKFRESVAALKIVSTMEVIEEIRTQNVPLADALEGLAREYRFDILQKIFDQNEHQ